MLYILTLIVSKVSVLILLRQITPVRLHRRLALWVGASWNGLNAHPQRWRSFLCEQEDYRYQGIARHRSVDKSLPCQRSRLASTDIAKRAVGRPRESTRALSS